MVRSRGSSVSEFRTRLERLARQVDRHRLDALVVLDSVNRLYLTGLRTTVGMLVVCRGEEPEFFTDFRYLEMARKAIDGARVRQLNSLPDQFPALARHRKWRRVGFEGSLPAIQWKAMREALPAVEQWVESGDLVLNLRARKSRAELAAMRRAVALGDEVFRRTAAEIRPGVTEWDIRRVLRRWIDDLDAGQESFDCIVSAGSNASKPHAQVTRRVWGVRQPLLIDMGVRLDNYCSDLTRMVFATEPSPRMREIYGIVLTAQRKAIEAVRPGRTGREVDAAARRYVEKRGFGKCFGHGLGHGLGLEIHEAPTLNRWSRGVLQPGMVMTIEPGVYLPGIGGVRIEDVVLVTRDGCEILTGTAKDLLILDR